MPEFKSHPQGMFCWSDCGTNDQNAAKSFYTSLFGLTVNDMPMGDYGVYSMLERNGKSVAAIYPQDPAQIEQRIPPNWQAYFALKSVDESARKVKSLGGQLMMEPTDVFDSGRMAVAVDPEGAIFGLWQANKHIGAQIKGDPGTLVWAEVMTRDPKRAEDFYTKLFGIKSEKFPGMENYIVLMVDKKASAGIFEMGPDMGAMPPNWAVYFEVADVDATVKKARQIKGKVMKEPWDIEGVGRLAFLEDPQGALFAVIKSVPQS